MLIPNKLLDAPFILLSGKKKEKALKDGKNKNSKYQEHP